MTELERRKRIITPIAQKHGVKMVWPFGASAPSDAQHPSGIVPETGLGA